MSEERKPIRVIKPGNRREKAVEMNGRDRNEYGRKESVDGGYTK